MSKLKAIHVAIIGTLICVIIGAATYFLIIKKSQAEIASLEGRKSAAEAVVRTRPDVELRLLNAQKNNRIVQAKLEKYMRTKMPSISFTDRAQGMIALWKEHAETLGPLLKGWPDHSGVRLTSTISVPSPPVDPNIIDANLITIPIGSFTVTGDFRTLMDHVRSWNKFNRLVQVDVTNLSGVSPYMTLTYNLTVYIFPRGEAAAAGGAGATPGATPAPGPQ